MKFAHAAIRMKDLEDEVLDVKAENESLRNQVWAKDQLIAQLMQPAASSAADGAAGCDLVSVQSITSSVAGYQLQRAVSVESAYLSIIATLRRQLAAKEKECARVSHVVEDLENNIKELEIINEQQECKLQVLDYLLQHLQMDNSTTTCTEDTACSTSSGGEMSTILSKQHHLENHSDHQPFLVRAEVLHLPNKKKKSFSPHRKINESVRLYI